MAYSLIYVFCLDSFVIFILTEYTKKRKVECAIFPIECLQPLWRKIMVWEIIFFHSLRLLCCLSQYFESMVEIISSYWSRIQYLMNVNVWNSNVLTIKLHTSFVSSLSKSYLIQYYFPVNVDLCKQVFKL